MKTKTTKPVGRPAIIVDEGSRKQSYTVSCTVDRRIALVKKYGSLTLALDTIIITK